MADHIAVARRRREDVEARCTGNVSPGYWSALRNLRKKALARTGRSSLSSSSRRPVSTDSGSIACFGKRGSRAMSSILPRSTSASAAASRPIDGEALVRALLAHKRGEPRVCAMVKAPTPKEEDRRRLCRERKVLIGERIRHVNRVKGLLFSQGISGYQPLRHDRRERLDTLQTGDGRLLPRVI